MKIRQEVRMKLLEIISFAVIGLAAVKAQIIFIDCEFSDINGVYTCTLPTTTVPDNDNVILSLGGQHVTNRTNADVREVIVSDSNIPFVISSAFISFTNLESLVINNGGLRRIQPNAFANAGRLTNLRIQKNTQLTSIPSNAFAGLSNLIEADLWDNHIETIDETAFVGLSSLRFLYLDRNYIRRVPVNTFRTLPALETVFLPSNQLDSLDGRLFSNNQQLRQINVEQNQINGIGRNLFDGLSRLNVFNALGNSCVDFSWRIAGSTTLETIRAGLSSCFDNFVPEDEVRRFILELRGPLSLQYENGTEIIRV